MVLKDKIVAVLPRENSGSTASNRFDFQKNWAICKILELHEKPDDYLVTFEYHDDIIVFDSSSSPQKIDFYQIKTKNEKSSHWTINSLLSRKKGKDGLLSSYLGKLFEHIINFGGDVQSLNFVTNAKIKGKLVSGVKCEDTSGFDCCELCKSDFDNIIDKLKDEHSLNSLSNFESIMSFKLGELDINNHTQITKANLADFIEINFPGIKYQVAPLYKSIFDEVKKRSNIEEIPTEFEVLKKKKSISRSDFDKYLSVVVQATPMKDVAAAIENRLNSESVSFRFLMAFRIKAKVFEIERMDYTNVVLNTVVRQCRDVVENYSPNESSLLASLDWLLNEVKGKMLPSHHIDDDYLKTIILFQLYE